MKGYAKVRVSRETVTALKVMIDKSDKFYSSVKSSDYIKTKTVKFLFFFSRTVEDFDLDRAELDADNNGCFLFISCLNTFRISFHQTKFLDGYRKILALALALSLSDEIYLDDELCRILNDYYNSKDQSNEK